MESWIDQARAFSFSLLLHAVIAAVALIGLWWTHEARPVVMPGQIIEATLVGPSAAPKPSATRPRPTPPRPPVPAKPEPAKPDPATAPPPPPPPKQDQVDQQRVTAMADQKAEEHKREQEAKERQRQIELDQERKETERQKELDAIRKQREAADQRTKLEQEKLAQLRDRQDADRKKAEQDQLARQMEHEAREAQTGAGGQDDDLRARYAAAIQVAVTRAWHRPESVAPGLRCTLRIVQIPGGDVLSVSVVAPCNADGAARNSIEQAVLRAAPLPYAGYEQVFTREVNFNFRFDGQG